MTASAKPAVGVKLIESPTLTEVEQRPRSRSTGFSNWFAEHGSDALSSLQGGCLVKETRHLLVPRIG